MTPIVLWPCVAGLFFLALGIAAGWRELVASHGLERLVALGRAFLASALGAFGAEHLAGPQFVIGAVPLYMPMRLFWAYFVGVALLAAALSIALDRYVKWSATLTGVMLLMFVVMVHLPNLAANPGDRIVGAVVLRDLGFAGGLLALGASRMPGVRGAGQLLLFGRVIIGVAALFFAVQHGLHPEFAPGVPLGKVTPGWVPLPALWGYIAGAFLLAGGIALLLNRYARVAAASLGLVMTLITVFLYLPIMLLEWQTPVMLEGLNYVFDTLLYAGTLLVLASALDTEQVARVQDRRSGVQLVSSPRAE
jgi:uncharacterized membrane protein